MKKEKLRTLTVLRINGLRKNTFLERGMLVNEQITQVTECSAVLT